MCWVTFNADRELPLGKSGWGADDRAAMSEISAFAPGRVELLGNHTDYNEGVVLSAALQLGITVRGAALDAHCILLSTEGLDGVFEGDRRELEPTGTWADYVLGVAKLLGGSAGFRAHYSSTLPLGAGLSSSAAMEVATAVLLGKLEARAMDGLALAKLCRRAENEFVGVNCGLLDQASSVFGRKDHAVYLDCRAETVETIPFPSHLGLLIVHSGVKHALTGGEYNERREQCFEAARRMGVPALRDVTSAGLAAAGLPPLVARRAAHIVGENERVAEALTALRAGDGERFGCLMTASHRSSMENFENSTPELDVLVDIATAQPGCHGARLTGGGFGGAIVALVDREKSSRVGAETVRLYRERTGHTAKAYECTAGDGALAASLS